MNEGGMVERFGRSRNAFRNIKEQAHVWMLPPRLNLRIRQYFEDAKRGVDGSSWLARPEIPTAGEVLDRDTNGSSNSSNVELAPNKPLGIWESKDAYLGALYELLREDAVRGIRDAVTAVRMTPSAAEEVFQQAIGIYEKVHICAITCSNRGIALRVTFSLLRTRKKILWEQSKRLITSTVVVLTPKEDMFQSKAIVAIVAARPLAALQQNPPEIDLFIARSEELELDPAQEFVMVEDRGGLYEANRHTMLALQHMMREPFPLEEHLVSAQTNIPAPDYAQQQPLCNLTTVMTNNKHQTYENVDILQGWPAQPQSDLDASQLAALRRILTKKLAIVQGPPGTGKTFVSVQAIKVMLANRKDKDPPIIIACQSNHAVDQILRHIAQFEPDFVRLGGRSKDRETIKARTLYEVRKLTSENQLAGSLSQNARKRMKEIEKEVSILLSPLKPENQPLDFRTLEQFGLLSQKQADSLEAGASKWVQNQLANPNEARSPFFVWLNKALLTVPPKQVPEDFGFNYEEADLKFEQLKDIEAESIAKDDEDFETLNGLSFAIADNFTCRKPPNTTDAKVKDALKEQDMWKIREADRPAIYAYLQAEVKNVMLAAFRKKAKEFNEQVSKRRIGFWEQDETILKNQKIIGMTTTGLSKYRGLLAALDPKIILIEEAAEILEAPVTVACMPSLQHLILVGDHKQLRPHCHVKQHEDSPFFLNVSLFERLINNNMDISKLAKQRRMIPEVRRVLYPIYGDLVKDHPSVTDPEKRPDVPGMGGVNSYFFGHNWPEQRDEHMSAYNPDEADMVVSFVEYLCYNGMDSQDITVLTFYNGQRKRILKQLRDKASLPDKRFTVVTVDSYQGEENKIVLLSLVRSNTKQQIGFLGIENRVCVALSRAQQGFYIFGNGETLDKNNIWSQVFKIMANNGKRKDRLKVEPKFRLGGSLPVRCSNHNNLTEIKDAHDFEELYGGCSLKCNGQLPCGHQCELTCHPVSHDDVNCQQVCGRSLSCGHRCEEKCREPCSCKHCNKVRAPKKVARDSGAFDGKETLSQQASTDSWKSFAEVEPVRYAEAAGASISRRSSPGKQDNASALVDLSSVDQVTAKTKHFSLGLDGTTSGSASGSSTVILEEILNAAGTRTKRKETFVAAATADSNTTTGHVKDWSKEQSLLD